LEGKEQKSKKKTGGKKRKVLTGIIVERGESIKGLQSFEKSSTRRAKSLEGKTQKKTPELGGTKFTSVRPVEDCPPKR